MATVKYRMENSRLRPRRTRLEIPGWAGQRFNREVAGLNHPCPGAPAQSASRSVGMYHT
jgi:hypothetical protein